MSPGAHSYWAHGVRRPVGEPLRPDNLVEHGGDRQRALGRIAEPGIVGQGHFERRFRRRPRGKASTVYLPATTVRPSVLTLEDELP